MPQDEGGLKGAYYGVSDKSWSFAEWMESKGVPIASFCDNHHINPILLFAAIILGILILLMLVMGAGFGVAYETSGLTITSDGVPLEGVTVSYEYGGEYYSNITNALGKMELKFPKGVEVEVSASKPGYKTSTTMFTFEEDGSSPRSRIVLFSSVSFSITKPRSASRDSFISLSFVSSFSIVV